MVRNALVVVALASAVAGLNVVAGLQTRLNVVAGLQTRLNVVAGLETRLHAQSARELTISGCLLSNGYAGYQVEEAVLDAVDGKPADDKTKAAAPAKWILDGGGNLRRRVGEKVQVVGKSEWRADGDDPSTPHLDVTTVTTLAASCK